MSTSPIHPIRAVTKAIGRERIAAALGITISAIREAERTRKLPAAWFQTVRRLGDEQAVEVPEGIFNWKASQ